jgi:hypothetical protein
MGVPARSSVLCEQRAFVVCRRRQRACEGHNVIVNQLPDNISNAYVVSAAGLNGVDQFHFDSAGVRTLGQRYGEAMIGTLGLSP